MSDAETLTAKAEMDARTVFIIDEGARLSNCTREQLLNRLFRSACESYVRGYRDYPEKLDFAEAASEFLAELVSAP